MVQSRNRQKLVPGIGCLELVAGIVDIETNTEIEPE